MEKRHLHTLFSRFFGNDFPKEVRNRFATWFIREEQADEKEEVLEDIWNSLPETIDFTSYAELKKVNKRIHPEKNSFYRRLAVIAAIIVLLCSEWGKKAGYFTGWFYCMVKCKFSFNLSRKIRKNTNVVPEWRGAFYSH